MTRQPTDHQTTGAEPALASALGASEHKDPSPVVKAGWTPGPWFYRPHELDDWGVVRSADGFVVTQARINCDFETQEAHRASGTDPAEANARLIASSPALAEALEGLLSANIIMLGPKMSKLEWTDGAAGYEAVRKAEAALRLARPAPIEKD